MFIPHRGVCNDSEIAESAGFSFSKRMAYREVLSHFQHILSDIMATRWTLNTRNYLFIWLVCPNVAERTLCCIIILRNRWNLTHWNFSPSLLHTRCPRRNGQNFGRVFLILNYTDITQNTYIQSWTVKDIMAIEKCVFLGCPRTVRRPWRHTHPLRMPGNQTPLAIIVMQWPWRDNGSAAACVKYLET